MSYSYPPTTRHSHEHRQIDEEVHKGPIGEPTLQACVQEGVGRGLRVRCRYECVGVRFHFQYSERCVVDVADFHPIYSLWIRELE